MNRFSIRDEVEIIETGSISYIVVIEEYNVTKEDVDGEIVHSSEVKYRLHKYGKFYTYDQLKFVKMYPEKEEEINSILINILLKERKFDAIPQLLDGGEKSE